MKFKPLYLYGIIVLVAILSLVIINSTGSESGKSTEITQNSMPQDDIHKGLTKEQGPTPSKGNVKQEFWNMLDKLEKEVEENPNDTLKIREYAEFLSLAHKTDKALIQYEKIIAINPNRIDVLLAEGLIYYNIGNFDKAEEVSKRILKINEKHLDAKFNLGTIAAAKGDVEKARQIWTEIVNDHPNTEASKFAEDALSRL